MIWRRGRQSGSSRDSGRRSANIWWHMASRLIMRFRRPCWLRGRSFTTDQYLPDPRWVRKVESIKASAGPCPQWGKNYGGTCYLQSGHCPRCRSCDQWIHDSPEMRGYDAIAQSRFQPRAQPNAFQGRGVPQNNPDLSSWDNHHIPWHNNLLSQDTFFRSRRQALHDRMHSQVHYYLTVL